MGDNLTRRTFLAAAAAGSSLLALPSTLSAGLRHIGRRQNGFRMPFVTVIDVPLDRGVTNTTSAVSIDEWDTDSSSVLFGPMWLAMSDGGPVPTGIIQVHNGEGWIAEGLIGHRAELQPPYFTSLNVPIEQFASPAFRRPTPIASVSFCPTQPVDRDVTMYVAFDGAVELSRYQWRASGDEPMLTAVLDFAPTAEQTKAIATPSHSKPLYWSSDLISLFPGIHNAGVPHLIGSPPKGQLSLSMNCCKLSNASIPVDLIGKVFRTTPLYVDTQKMLTVQYYASERIENHHRFLLAFGKHA